MLKIRFVFFFYKKMLVIKSNEEVVFPIVFSIYFVKYSSRIIFHRFSAANDLC